MMIIEQMKRFTTKNTPFFLLFFLTFLSVACTQQRSVSSLAEDIATPISTAVQASASVELPEIQPTEPAAEALVTEMATSAATATPIATVTPTTPAADEQPSPLVDCPTALDGLQRLANPQHGYCLLYPEAYKVEKPTVEETALVIGGLLNPSDARIQIHVLPADTRSADEIADQMLAELGDGWEIERSSVALGGETAVRLDGLPGQETSRKLIAVHESYRYTLTFAPLNNEDLETLYNQVVDTFTFITPSMGEFDDCLQATEKTQLLRQEDQGVCLLLPADYQTEQPDKDQTAVYIDSPLNNGGPRLFIGITDAEGQTTAEAAEALIAEFGPEFNIQRTFGVTLGYEHAEQLDNVPGQDFSRVLLVVHNGRLYKLTFIPAGIDAAEIDKEMEVLYDLVAKSFRFLP